MCGRSLYCWYGFHSTLSLTIHKHVDTPAQSSSVWTVGQFRFRRASSNVFVTPLGHVTGERKRERERERHPVQLLFSADAKRWMNESITNLRTSSASRRYLRCRRQAATGGSSGRTTLATLSIDQLMTMHLERVWRHDSDVRQNYAYDWLARASQHRRLQEETGEPKCAKSARVSPLGVHPPGGARFDGNTGDDVTVPEARIGVGGRRSPIGGRCRTGHSSLVRSDRSRSLSGLELEGRDGSLRNNGFNNSSCLRRRVRVLLLRKENAEK